jgi:hypothetical protein
MYAQNLNEEQDQQGRHSNVGPPVRSAANGTGDTGKYGRNIIIKLIIIKTHKAIKDENQL